MIPIVWHEGVRWYGCTKFLNDIFENTPLCHPEFAFEHFLDAKQVPDAEEAIVVIHGDHQVSKVYDIQQFLKKFDRCVVINIGDESALFPLEQLRARGRHFWTQCAVPGQHDYARHFILGYPPDGPPYFENLIGANKTRDWFFSGQITHLHRQRCAEQLRTLGNGLLIETAGFWQGLGREKYYEEMSKSKVIPCPSGPVTPDSFRLWECIALGCTPIVDATCPKSGFPTGFWEYTLHQTPPFPIIYDWKNLPDLIAEEVRKFPQTAYVLQVWWNRYQAASYDWLVWDFNGLRGETCLTLK